MDEPQVNIIVPLFNEQDSFHVLIERLSALVNSSDVIMSVILVDDGSFDDTPFLMEKQSVNDSRFTSIFLSKNFGHQFALTAALSQVDASEAVLIIDGDLQDPPELFPKLYEELKKGYDVVYAIRKKRKENIIKRISYKLFYRLMNKISYINIPLDAGDFSLISRRVVEHLNAMKEESRFLRGMRSWVGFKQIGIIYDRDQRSAGKSKYSVSRLVRLAFSGIFNFSEAPIRFISLIGVTTILLSVIYLTYTLIKLLFFDQVPEGFTGLMSVIILFGGVQLLSIGIIGEYILKIFFQVKNRPLFIIKKIVKNGQEVL